MKRLVCIGVLLSANLLADAQTKAPPPPHLVMERLSRMTPEERDRLLSRMRPERRAILERRLEKYKSLPESTKARLREEYSLFQQLPPDKQNEVRRLFQQFSGLPEDRRRVLRRELFRLRNMPARRAAARMNSEAFRVEFSDAERRMLESLTSLLSK